MQRCVYAYLELVLIRCEEKIRKKKPQATFPCRHPVYTEVERKIVCAVRCDDNPECYLEEDEKNCSSDEIRIILGQVHRDNKCKIGKITFWRSPLLPPF